MCRHFKHHKCYGLTKTDVDAIINSPDYKWSCYDCLSAVLPINAHSSTTCHPLVNHSLTQHRVKCHSCGGMSYRANAVNICPWCANTCHNKCIKGVLGCLSCCDEIIPGNRYHAYELLDVGSTVNSKFFNPYERNSLINYIGDQIRSVDEHSEAWADLSDKLDRCKYQSPRDIPKPSFDELAVLSLNIRSIHKNVDKINESISEYYNYDVINLNETSCNMSKLANGADDLLIDGFHPPIHQSPARTSCRGGGLLTYVNKRVCNTGDIESIKSDLQPNISGELLITKIKSCKKHKNTVLIVNVYRSPSSQNVAEFVKILDENLFKLRKHIKKLVLMADDFDIDLLKYSTDINSQSLIDTAASHGFAQVISRPTRITDHSATLIDHIFINNVNKLVSSSVVSIDLSDHLGPYARLSLDPSYDSNTHYIIDPSCKPNNHVHNPKEFRVFNEANHDKFRELVQCEQWDALEGLNAEAKYEKFYQTYMSHYEAAYPLNTERKRRKFERLNPKPWITPWLEDAIHRKNLLYIDYSKNQSIQNKATYDSMKKFCEKHKNKAKSRYYKKYFDEHSENSRKQWQMINNLLNRNKKSSGIDKLVDKDGSVASTPSEIGEKFNEYFSNIASNLKSKIEMQENDRSYSAFLNDPVPLSIFLKPVGNSEVGGIIKSLKNKSTQDSKISALKIAGENPNFIHALAQTISKSLEEGVFPQSLKLAKVVPIHKGGSTTDVSNYRPISLLATFSKIYEKVMHSRLVDFLEKNNSLHDRQYGFRSGRSCEHALLDAQNTLLDS